MCSSMVSRYVPVEVKYFVRTRDGDACQYTDPITNQKCGAKKYIELDHIRPFSKNGLSSVSIRLGLKTDNQRLWCLKEVMALLKPTFTSCSSMAAFIEKWSAKNIT